MSRPQISIILLTKNAGNIFFEVLDKLINCEGIDKAEIIIIDSGSTDFTKQYAQRYHQIRLVEIDPEDFGHGKTRNLGASLAYSDILVYLVQDATPATTDFLTRLVAPLADQRVAAVFGRQLPRADTNPIEKYFLQTTYPNLPQTRDANSAAYGTIQSIFFSNVCSAIKRNLWEQVPFNESLIMSEDQQWAREILQKGYSIVYEPAAVVLHSHNYELKRVFQRNFDSGYSLTGIVTDSLTQMIQYELNYILSGIKQLNSWSEAVWIPYFFCYELTRSLGFFLGKNALSFPNRMKYDLSLHKSYWNGIIKNSAL